MQGYGAGPEAPPWVAAPSLGGREDLGAAEKERALERRGRLGAGKTRMELRGPGYGFCWGHRAVLGARGECQVSGGGVLATVWPGLALNCLALGAGVARCTASLLPHRLL